MKNKRNTAIKLEKRGDELSVVAAQGLYNQLLFDLCSDDALMAFSLANGYNAALDVIGFETSNVQHIKRNMITYVAPAGTAAGSPVVSDQSDPCEPGTATEFGGCGYELTGWGRLRKSSPVRDITDIPIKWCETQPSYDIAGNRIDDDYEWDTVQQMAVILQDFQRRFINGNSAVAGQHDGLANIVTYGYADPDSGEACSAMDSTVIDYNENLMCGNLDEDGVDVGASGVTFNGVATTDGYDFYHYVASFLRRTRQRIAMSSLSGLANHIGLLPTEHLNCLIECYVCFTHCGGEKSQMFEMDVQAILNQLKNQVAQNNSVVLSFYGVPVTFYTYDYGLLNADGELGDIYILTTNVGNTPLVKIQIKDMTTIANHPAVNVAEMRVTDSGRILSWTTTDHTCFQTHVEMQWRIFMPAPWAMARFIDVSCVPLLGAISSDPLSPFFPESNLVAYPRASGFQTYTAPQAVNDFYTRATGAANLVVAAGSGLLANDVLGFPAAAVTPVAAVATTAGGTITITADGAFTYTPPSATFAGTDTYTYTLSNAQGSDTAVLTVVSFVAAA